MMLMAVLWVLVAVVVIRWLTAPDAARLPPEQAERLEAEIGRLRDEVDRLGQQVERLLDEQSFLLGLLERGDEPRPLPPANQPGDPNADT